MKARINRSQKIGENHIKAGTEVKVIKKNKNISVIEINNKKHFVFTEDLTFI